MADSPDKKSPLDRLGPALFIVVLVLILVFFWWFVRA